MLVVVLLIVASFCCCCSFTSSTAMMMVSPPLPLMITDTRHQILNYNAILIFIQEENTFKDYARKIAI